MGWLAVDLAILGIIGICIILGYRRGLIGVAFKIISFILAIFIAFILYKPVSNFIVNNTSVGDKIKAVVIERVKIQNDAEQEEETGEETSVGAYISNTLKYTTVDVANSAIVAVAEQITMAIVNIMVFIIVYVLARIILMVTKGLLDFVAGLPIIKQSNKIGGIIYGLLQGLLIVYLALAIISLVAISSTSEIIELINKSVLGKIMYQNNLILMIFFRPKY